MRTNAASFGLSLAIGVFFLACSEPEQNPIVPEQPPSVPEIIKRDTATIGGLVTSNVVASLVLSNAGLSGAFSTLSDDIAFVSAAPGTFTGLDSIYISNSTRTTTPRSAKLLNGGFDPIAINAEPEDLLELTVVVTNGARGQPLYVKVPPRRPPMIVRTNPSRGRTDVALNVQITVVFSEPVDKSSITTSSLTLSASGNAVAGKVRVADDGLSAEFIPENSLEAGATYDLAVKAAIRDLNGEALGDPTTITFTTLPPPEKIAFEILGGTIYAIEADGSDSKSLLSGKMPSWLPGGRLVFIRQSCTDCAFVPWIREADGSQHPLFPENFSSGNDVGDPTPTADGSRIAMIRFGGTLRVDRTWERYASNALVIFDTRSLSLSTVPLPLRVIPIARPSWSPDESRLVFSCTDDAESLNFDMDLCFVNVDGSNFERYGKSDEWEVDPAWNQKTGAIAYTRVIDLGGTAYAYVEVMISEDGAGLTEYGGGQETTWSPDGKTLLYCRGPWAIRNMSTGVDRVLWGNEFVPSMYHPSWGRM